MMDGDEFCGLICKDKSNITDMASSQSQLVIGYVSVITAMIAATSSAACAQGLLGAIPDFQLSISRSLIQCVLYVIYGKLAGAEFIIIKERMSGLLYLGFAYLLLNVGYYGAAVYLPLTEANGVFVIANIVTAFLHSRLFFQIEITKSRIISLVVCVVGILLAAQPTWLFHQLLPEISQVPHFTFGNISETSHRLNISHQYDTEPGKSEVLLGYLLGVVGGIGSGLMYDISGIILKDVTPIVKVTHAVCFCMIGSVVMMFYMEEPVLMIDVTQSMLVIGHGVLSAFMSFLFIQSAHYIPGPTLSAISSLEMVMMIMYQYTVMHSIRPGNYNVAEVIGCTVIIIGASIPSLVDILAHRAESDQLP